MPTGEAGSGCRIAANRFRGAVRAGTTPRPALPRATSPWADACARRGAFEPRKAGRSAWMPKGGRRHRPEAGAGRAPGESGDVAATKRRVGGGRIRRRSGLDAEAPNESADAQASTRKRRTRDCSSEAVLSISVAACAEWRTDAWLSSAMRAICSTACAPYCAALPPISRSWLASSQTTRIRSGLSRFPLFYKWDCPLQDVARVVTQVEPEEFAVVAGQDHAPGDPGQRAGVVE